MSKHPVVAWAQRSNATDAAKNIVYLTIEVQDPIDVKLDLTATHLIFSAQSSDKATQYDLNLEFFAEIDPENSRKHIAGNKISLVLRKKEAKEEFWPRLLKEKVKLHYIKTDFDKWVDEDEQEELPEENDDMANMANMMDMGGMGGMPGMGGMGGMPGMGGPGGPDLSQLLGGAGGAGGDFDFSKLASQLGQSAPGEGEDDDEDDEESVEEEINLKN